MLEVTDQVIVHQYETGIPRLAAFINSSDHNAIFRRFGRLSARVLVQRQMELTALETTLDKLDKADALDPVMKKRLRGYQFPEDDGRQEALLGSIEEKLCRYCEFTSHDVEDARGGGVDQP
jgi:hypothetical protein